MRQRSKSEEETAYDEAGHAVMAFKLQRPVPNLSIVLDQANGSFGLYLLEESQPQEVEKDRLDGRVQGRHERFLKMLLAGGVADAIGRGRPYRGVGVDHEAAVSLASALLVDAKVANAYVAYLVAWTDYTLRLPANWRAVEALAKELLTHRRLSGRIARQVYFKAVKSSR